MIGIYSLGGGRIFDGRRGLDFARSERLGVWPWMLLALGRAPELAKTL